MIERGKEEGKERGREGGTEGGREGRREREGGRGRELIHLMTGCFLIRVETYTMKLYSLSLLFVTLLKYLMLIHNMRRP